MSVIVIGDVMLDINYIGNATRLAQESCIPIVNIKDGNKKISLGGAGNIYRNLLNMGIRTHLISVIGQDCGMLLDEVESIWMRYLEQEWCSYDTFADEPTQYLFVDSDRHLTTKNRFFVNNKIIFRYDVEDTHDITQKDEERIFDALETRCAQEDVIAIVLSDYNKGVLTSSLTRNIIQYAVKNNIKVFIDPKTKDIEKYSGGFLIKPNKQEGELICGKKITNENLSCCVEDICRLSGCQNCLLTLGEEGLVFNNGKTLYCVPASKNDVIDITGAGDVVLAGLIYYHLMGYQMSECANFANYCGQVKVRNCGTYAITKYDILMYEKTKSKYIPEQDVKKNISIIKDVGKKIVLTNGCFDILHYGHLSLFEEAKKKGDILIVALNSDKSVKTNKGDTRPINNLHYRMKQLSVIECIDFIIVFDEKTPINIVKLIQPDVLIKGGDYKIDDIVGREYAKETIIYPYQVGFSTTSIIEQIKK